MKQFFSGVWQTAKVLYTTFSLSAVLALVILLLAFAESQEQDLSETLTITIVILVGAILAAAARATLVQSIFRNATGQRPYAYRPDLGPVFERHIKWFSYVIGPVIASYGVVRIIEALK